MNNAIDEQRSISVPVFLAIELFVGIFWHKTLFERCCFLYFCGRCHSYWTVSICTARYILESIKRGTQDIFSFSCPKIAGTLPCKFLITSFSTIYWGSMFVASQQCLLFLLVVATVRFVNTIIRCFYFWLENVWYKLQFLSQARKIFLYRNPLSFPNLQ